MSDRQHDDRATFANLLFAARAGDRNAIGKVLKRYERVLLHAARHDVPPDLQAKAGASDLVQQTYLDAHRDFPRFAGTTEAELMAWLRRLLWHNFANFVRDYRRREKRQVSREEPLGAVSGRERSPEHRLVSNSPGPPSDAIRRETTERCRRAIARLPERHQELVRLRFQERLSYPEIGAQLNISQEAVRKLLVRVLRTVGTGMESI